MRFRDFGELWLDSYVKTATKPSTLRSYSDIVRGHLIPEFGDMYLTAITAGLLQKYVAERLDAVKPKTVVNEIVVIKEMFKHARRWGYVKSDPAQYLERPRVPREEMSILELDEIKAFLEQASPAFRVLFMTAVLTGLRRGELLGLQRRDIDWRTNHIHVARSIWRGQLTTPKSKASNRKVYMVPALAHELKKHLLATHRGEQDLVFCNPDGNPLDPDNMVKREFLPALRRAGLRQIRFHDLRHTNVALRIRQGQNLTYIKEQLGHESITTTIDRYGHITKDVSTEEAHKFDSVLDFVNFEEFGRRMVEKGKEKGLEETPRPLSSLVAGIGFEPMTFGL